MTTGRINQVTTFRPAFAAIVYSRVIEHSLSRCGVRHSLMVFSSRSIAAQDGLFLSVRVTHPLEPTNGITSFPILAHLKWDPLVPWKEQRSPTFNGDYQRPMTPKRHTRRRGGSPSGLKAASGLAIGKQSTSFNIAQARRTRTAWGFKGKQGKRAPKSPRPVPLSSQASRIAGLINSTWDDPVNHKRGLLKRRANCIRSSPLSTPLPRYTISHQAY